MPQKRVLCKCKNNLLKYHFYSQDLFSYRKERLSGDCEYNSVTIVMHHLGLSLNEAVAWVADRHQQSLQKFLATREKVLNKDGYPSYGSDLDRQIVLYTGVIADWIRGNYEWSWHSQRFVNAPTQGTSQSLG